MMPRLTFKHFVILTPRLLGHAIALPSIALLALCLVAQQPVNAQIANRQETEQTSDSEDAASLPLSKQSAPNLATDANLQLYQKSIKPLLQQACFECHSGDEVEGNFRADQLDPDLVNGGDIAWWLEVYAVVSKGEMPPPESADLTETQRSRIVDWLSSSIQAAENARHASGSHSSFRRLTRYEYNYALQDLLGVPWTFASDLPAEASEDDAFENNAESLHMSAKQVETYRQLALKALRRVTVRGERPPVVHWSIPVKDAFQRERKGLERDIKKAKEKFEDMPDKLAEQIARLKEKFQSPTDKSHYLDLSTGLRAEIDWNYRKATHAFKHRDSLATMPELGSHFAIVQPGSRQALTVELGDHLANEGTMRVRIRASRARGMPGNDQPQPAESTAEASGSGEDTDQRIPSLQLYFGFQATDQGRSIKRISNKDAQINAAYGQPEIYEWSVWLGEIEHRNTYRGEMKLGDQPSPSEYIRFANSTVGDSDTQRWDSSAILIDYVEVAAPVYDTWPPQSHRNVFIESDNAQDEEAYAREIITAFLSRAWRRPATRLAIERKLALFHRLRPSSQDFQEAIVEVLATILCSPKFLYVLPGDQKVAEPLPEDQTAELTDTEEPAEGQAEKQTEDRLSPNELATRLSLFLWCSLPDETLLELATAGRLNDDETLRQQVDRMLGDERATRFPRHFVAQWLKMQPLEYLSPTRGKGGLDAALLESIKQEPIALFTDMLRNNSNMMDLIDSEYAVINERLAAHYEIPSVQGNHFRRVTLLVESQRGGVLTQAGLLTMNSDGQDSHPVKRGVWLLTNLLNDPPPPPPPAVPEIDLTDPEIAKLTLKQRIEDHRNHAACLSCHQKIDPWGIAFENYDAMGRWREKVDEKIVDATSVLPNEDRLDGMKGLKAYLVQNRKEQFVRATVEKMAAFALGRQLAFGDRAEVTKVVERVRESGGGIKSMVICLVTSDLFQSK